MIYIYIVFTMMLLIIGETRSQTIYIATDTLELEVGSGKDLGVNGKNGIWEYPFNNNPKNGLKFRATFKNDTLNGPFEAFWQNGERKALITFDMGNKNGEAFYYSIDGRLKYRMTYTKDTLNGPFKEYYKNGVKMKDLNFRKGKLDGICRSYRDTKKQVLLAEGEFLNGLPSGTYTNCVDGKRKIVEIFQDGYPIEGQRIFISGELVGELVLGKKKMEYSEIVSYKKGIKIKTEAIPEGLKRNFMYGKYLFLPSNFK